MATASAKKNQQSVARRPVTIPDSMKTSEEDVAALNERTVGEQIKLATEDARFTDAEKVTVLVPVAFTLTRDGGQPVEYQAGTQEMIVDDAAHWFSKANGVKVYDPSAKN